MIQVNRMLLLDTTPFDHQYKRESMSQVLSLESASRLFNEKWRGNVNPNQSSFSPIFCSSYSFDWLTSIKLFVIIRDDFHPYPQDISVYQNSNNRHVVPNHCDDD